MLRGIYAAASGMAAQEVRQAATSNNIANASTVGYKRDVAVSQSFAMALNDVATGSALGKAPMLISVAVCRTDMSMGVMTATDGTFDLGLEGEGFFVIETEAGERYTRAGSFQRDAEGWLVTPEGHRVLGVNGPVRVGAGFTVAADGSYSSLGEPGGTLLIMTAAKPEALVKAGEALFMPAEGDDPSMAPAAPGAAQVVQGMLEMSNVNVVREMVDMITGFRAYEAMQRAITSHDALLDAAINQVGRIA